MRILHVSTWDTHCGIATYCGNLVRALDRRGMRNDVYPLAPHLWQSLVAGDVTDLLADIAAESRGYDLVHVQHEHGLFGHAVSYKAAARNYGTMLRLIRTTGRPVVTTFHTGPLGSLPPGSRLSVAGAVKAWGRRRAWRRHVSRNFGPRSAGPVAIAHTLVTRRALIRRGIPAASVHVIPHGCLPHRDLRIDALSAKGRLGLPASSVLLTMFGFVGGYKGHDIAVRALARLPERFHLAICGGAHPESQDRTLAAVIRLMKKLGLEQRVTITGWLPEGAADLYAAATDVCLAPYRDEALSASGAITWALASGRPIVASRIAAFQAICREQPCMLLATPGMVDEFAWAVEKTVTDREFSHGLVTAARRYTQAHSWDETARRTHELYTALVAGTAAATAGVGRGRVVARATGGEAEGETDGAAAVDAAAGEPTLTLVHDGRGRDRGSRERLRAAG
jgi:glycosyltransferase involved in cell wall biosynthesis